MHPSDTQAWTGRLRRPVTPAAPRCEATSAGWRVLAATLLIGATALVLGLLVYLADRDPARSALLGSSWPAWRLAWFGAAGGWLPTLLHTFGFGLLSAAAWPPHRAAARWSCVFWALVNLLFELGQHPAWQRPLAAAVDSLDDRWGAAAATARLLAQGRFDPGDLVAAAAGAALAMAWLSLCSRAVSPRAAQPAATSTRWT